MKKAIVKYGLGAAIATVALAAHADVTISLKSGESSRLGGITWTNLACGNMLEAVEGLDIMEAPSTDLKVRFEPAKITVSRQGCTQLVEGAYLYVDAGKIEKKLSGPLVVRSRLKSTTGPVQSTYRYSVLLYPASSEEKK